MQIAFKLKKPQSFISKYEAAERRLDIIEFVEVCSALNCDAARLIEELGKYVREERINSEAMGN